MTPRLAPMLGRVAVVTGRPVHQVVELGGFHDRPGLESLVVFGQYGAERWDAADGRPEPSALAGPVRDVMEDLPVWLAAHGGLLWVGLYLAAASTISLIALIALNRRGSAG